MKKFYGYIVLACIMLLCINATGQNQVWFPKVTPFGKKIVNTRVDNLAYWQKMISLGYVEANPYLVTESAVPTGSQVNADGIFMQDSPDVPTTSDPNTTQSEISVFVNPMNEDVVLNSNNSTDWTGSTINQLFGADYLYSSDAAATWGGSISGAGQVNAGDPSTAIGRNGWWYVGKIAASWGQNVSYSTDQGQTWIDVISGPAPGGYDLLDKNHLWIDNSQSSPYEGNLYNAWTSFINGAPNDGQIEVVRSTDHGLTWTSPLVVSSAVNAGSHNQGVNIQTGPDGEVYVFWTIYDSWPSDESALGMAKSIDGGSVFTPAVRIIDNIKGIRTTGTSKNMRVNSFPVSTVDISDGPNRGNIYIVWANIGVPGINSGNDIDVYMLRSTDQGATWSSPIRINQDPSGLGKEHYLPWITCDPVTGNLCVVFYDDRNTGSTQCETWVSWSYDAGETWTDMKVSDVAFTPGPIPGLAGGYFGDYLGISSNNMKVYPVWTDNRSGKAMSYVSPVDLGPPPNQPFVTYYSNQLSSIPGKGRQDMNFGDSLYLDLGLKNIGDQPASDLVATLRAESPYILITDTTEPYGTMAPGEIKTVPEGYSFKVSDSIPDNLKVRFDVHISDADTTWVSHFSVEAHAPHLVVTHFEVDDALTGNNNKRLDPGETANIIVTTSNTGDFDCLNTTGTLVSLSDIVTVNSASAVMDTITQGGSKIAVFNVTVDEEAPIGTGVNLLFNAVSGFYHASYNYQETIGVIMEDWETHTFTKFPWQFGGDKQWVQTNVDPFEGTWTAESGWIYDQQSTELFISYTTTIDDSITFYRKVSSEADWDFLYFYIDNVQVGAWSGNVAWGRASFPVTAGTHTYKWSYVKDIFLSAGDDRAWVDYIGFPPPILPVMNAGPDDTICAGSVYHLENTDGAQYDSLLWTTHGDGTFDTVTVLHPVYTPGPNDVLSGTVKLTLKGYAPYGLSYNSMYLTIGEIPQVAITFDPKDTLCQGQSTILKIDTLESGNYLWSPGGFTTPEITVDTSVTGGLGTTWFKVIAANKFGCANTDSIAITFKDCTAIDELGNNFRFSATPNPSNGFFLLRIHTPARETLKFRLYSENRTLLWSEEGVTVGSDLTRPMDFTNLAAGLYIFEVERPSGVITEKIIIRK
jgi:hypothetical protein